MSATVSVERGRQVWGGKLPLGAWCKQEAPSCLPLREPQAVQRNELGEGSRCVALRVRNAIAYDDATELNAAIPVNIEQPRAVPVVNTRNTRVFHLERSIGCFPQS